MSSNHQPDGQIDSPEQHPKAGRSLRLQLLLAAILLAVIPVALVAVLLTRNTADSLEGEVERGVSNEAVALRATLDEVVNNRASDVLLMSGSDFLFLDPEDAIDKQAFLLEHGVVWDYAGDITVVDQSGTVLVGYEEAGAYPNQTESKYFQQALALNDGAVFVGDISPDPITGQTVINIASPSYSDSGEVLGVVRIAWPVSDFNAFLETLGGDARNISVFDSTGILVGSSDPSQTASMTSSTSEAVRRAIRGEAGVMLDSFGASGQEAEEHFVAFGPVQASQNVAVLDWSVAVASPRDLALEPVADSQNLAVGVFILVVIVAIIAAYVLARLLVRPIRRLADVAVAVASGSYDARADVGGPSEVSTTAVAVNQMLDEITGLIQTREEKDAIQREVSQLLVEVSDVARGNLTVETHPDMIRDETLGSIASSFNYMVTQLRAIVSDVNETTNAVTSASTGIAERSSNLALISTSNSQRITETANALDEMVLSMQDVNENARLSSSVAAEARGNAEAGAQAMHETIEALQAMRDQIQEAGRTVTRLGESSQEIGQTVQIISQIARQTNTLALNASIQAARSGEHGRGFAVVAEEVRKLAERAASATRQIETMVKTIQADTDEAVTAMTIGSRQVAEGVDLAGRTGSRLGEIDAVINRLGELIDTMSAAAEEQAATAVELAQAMRSVSTSTAESTESTQDAAESATMLARLAERLRDSVAVFRLGEDEAQTPVPAPTPADGD